MVKNHIKRINAPKRWDILRKEHKFISRPNPGRTLELSISLNTALKEMVGITQTTKESKYLIKSRGAFVNGVRRYDEKFPVGFLDVLSIPETDENYRLLVNDHNKLALHKITDAESKMSISIISDKHPLSAGSMQINCTDGRNFLMSKKEAESVATNDSLVYALPDQKVKEVLKLEKGCLVFLYKGKHIGRVVKVEDFKGSSIIFKSGNESFETKKSYAVVVGKDNPAIAIPGYQGTKPSAGRKVKNQ
jgi:small subunit ribosomal protein S4e